LDFEDIERILELVRQHDLVEFELERDGLKLRVRKGGPGLPPLIAAAPAAIPPVAPHAPPPPVAVAPILSAPADTEDLDKAPLELAVVKSPIVGTFYRAAEPGAPSFVEIGQQVKKDQVLCIIEAMKLMNEITSEYEGEIINIYVENGKPVQYGERLFAIKTA
jgi:acetyl-CoA carboxylase biotin carboxyl carrier protein